MPKSLPETLRFHPYESLLSDIYTSIISERRFSAYTPVTVQNTKTSKTGHIHDDRYYTEAEIEAKFNQRMLIPSPTSSSGGISTYQIKPQIADQGIFCFCRSELYIVRLGQSGGAFNAYDLIQISDHTATTNASVSMTADKKALIFKCAQFENPIFIGRF